MQTQQASMTLRFESGKKERNMNSYEPSLYNNGFLSSRMALCAELPLARHLNHRTLLEISLHSSASNSDVCFNSQNAFRQLFRLRIKLVSA